MAVESSIDEIMAVITGYQKACVLVAAADLDAFTVLSAKPMTAQSLSVELGTDLRATTVLLDALVALKLLSKDNAAYSVPSAVAELLTEKGAKSILPMVRHHGNCLRRWVRLPWVTQTGKPTERSASIRGQTADQAAFIGAMNNFSSLVATEIVEQLQPLSFRHFLDIGGASGTWTIAFLRAVPEAKATLFDLPEVIPMARQRIAEAGLTERVTFVGGNFYTDDLPAGADFAWLGAIAHQNSRKQNRELFARTHEALEQNGILVVRDVVMDKSRTSPEAGAMFAVNMLVATDGGGTYTFDEFREDLLEAGFSQITLLRRDEFMNSLIRASKPNL